MTGSALVKAAREVADVAAVHAAASEAGRRLVPEVARAIVGAGFARHFVPAHWGGTEGNVTDSLLATAAVAEGDASAAWVASIAASLGRMATFLPEEGQRAVWSTGPDTFIACALVPGGEAREVDGGWRVSGLWPYLSGVHFSEWALVCCPVPMPGGEREVRFLLVPRSAYEIVDTWFPVGMRATGSDSLRLADVFVPYAYSFARADLLAGRSGAPLPAASAVPLKAVSALSFAGPVLGAAKGALREFSTALAGRRAAGAPGHRVSGTSKAAAELALARTAGEIDAAELLLRRAAAVADAGAIDDRALARTSLDHALAVDMLAGAVNRLTPLAGTRSQSDSAPFQRFWRDVNTAAGHTVLQFEPAARAFAGLALEA
ncbi:acyl-CoA dehydrogenase family protein [Streptomyces sp. NPDC001719]